MLRTPWQADWQPATVVTELGYTPMTLSRAVRELVAAGIATLHNEGKTRWLRMAPSAADTWERARPLLRTPVKRRVRAHLTPTVKPQRLRLAGPSALARLSMLADPEWSTFAVSPALVPHSETVDPLSLTLSLQDEADERVQLALDALGGTFPW